MEGHAWFWILFGVLWVLSCGRGWAWGCGNPRSRRTGWAAQREGMPSDPSRRSDRPRARHERASRRQSAARLESPRRTLRGETPVEALQRRFVEGQLTMEEYEEKLAHLFRQR